MKDYIAQLNLYFENTSTDQVNRDLAEIEELYKDGPTLESLMLHQTFCQTPKVEYKGIENPEYSTLDFLFY